MTFFGPELSERRFQVVHALEGKIYPNYQARKKHDHSFFLHQGLLSMLLDIV